jgi:hypothetical protein
MSFNDIIADYITQQRSLGKRYTSEANVLKAFGRSIGNVPIRDIDPEMISRFVDRGTTSCEDSEQEVSRAGRSIFLRRLSPFAEDISNATTAQARLSDLCPLHLFRIRA